MVDLGLQIAITTGVFGILGIIIGKFADAWQDARKGRKLQLDKLREALDASERENERLRWHVRYLTKIARDYGASEEEIAGLPKD